MKLQQLEHVIAIAQEGSITAAAKRLHHAQPNISLSVKELEEELGTQIFWRNSSGMSLTPEGEKFLAGAEEIVTRMKQLEEEYVEKKKGGISFRVAAVSSCCITPAVGAWLNSLGDGPDGIHLDLSEGEINQVIDLVSAGKSDVGVIRVPEGQYGFFGRKLEEKRLSGETLAEFNMCVLIKNSDPLSRLDDIKAEQLSDYTEIVNSADDVKNFGKNFINRNFVRDPAQNTVYVRDRGSRVKMLDVIKNSYMWVSPYPYIDCNFAGLVLKRSSYADIKVRDIVIWREKRPDSRLTESFVKSLSDYYSEISGRLSF